MRPMLSAAGRNANINIATTANATVAEAKIGPKPKLPYSLSVRAIVFLALQSKALSAKACVPNNASSPCRVNVNNFL